MRTWKFGWMMGLALVLLVSATPAIAQEHGESGGGGCGDVFGDLIHITRDSTTGQPILAQRWIELPAEVPGYGWGYCLIAVTADGQEIPFLPYTCDLDIDPLSDNFVGPPVEVNYFQRLNGGRTKPRNNRMHFDEVVSNIKAGMMVKRGPAGRLMIGYDCKDVGKPPCDEWATVDSPMENMGLYVRLTKFGHLAADPYEIDIWAHGDPKLPTQFHPALGEEDWPKFHNTVEHMLPSDRNKPLDPEDCWDYEGYEVYTDLNEDGVWNPAEPFIDINKDGYHDEGEPFTDLDLDGEWDAAEPFIDTNGNGVPDEFTFLCADQEQLGNRDFVSVAAFLGAAASKTGKVTWDLVQYWNRILKVTKTNEYTGPLPLNTLPALYRDCWEGPDPEDPPEEGGVPDPDYLTGEACTVEEVVPYDPPPNYDLFIDLKEKFVDFEGLDDYEREGEEIEAIKSSSEDTWMLAEDVSLSNWVVLVNGAEFETENIAGFVNAASDFLRMIEFIHNYDPPVDLYCTYDTEDCGVYE